MFEVSESTLFLFRSSASAKKSAILDPEVLVEATLELCCVALEVVGPGVVVPELARQAGSPHLGVVDVALELAGGARRRRNRAIGERDRVPRVLPALVVEPGLLIAARTRRSRRRRDRRSGRSIRWPRARRVPAARRARDRPSSARSPRAG